MFKPLIAGITALSLTLSTATPTQAQGLSQDDIGKLLFGLAALAAIGTLVENSNDRDRNRVSRSVRVEPPRQHHSSNRAGNRVLPRQCLRGFETNYGTHRMFGARCLRNNYARFEQLPRSCRVRLVTAQGTRRGFDPACLRGQGYTARR